MARPTVGITADRRWEEQAALFRRRGIDVLHGPTMRTLDLSGDVALRTATEALVAEPPDVLVATTGAGVKAWLAAADGWGLGDRLRAAVGGPSVVVVARGAKAASALRQAGLPLSWRAPGESMAEVVSHVVGLPDVARARVAVQLFDPDDHPATEAIRSAAAALVEVPVYRWLPPADPAPALALVDAACRRGLAAVTFTSQPAVHFLFSLAASAGRREELVGAFEPGGVLPVCIGAVCAEAAVEEGLTTTVWPETFRLPPMVRLVAERLGVDPPGAGQTPP